MRKVDAMRRQNHETLTLSEQFRGSDTFDGKLHGHELERQQIEDADLRDFLRILHSQKQGIEVLQGALRSQASQLMVMEKELGI